jgi:hypothetical protein
MCVQQVENREEAGATANVATLRFRLSVSVKSTSTGSRYLKLFIDWKNMAKPIRGGLEERDERRECVIHGEGAAQKRGHAVQIVITKHLEHLLSSTDIDCPTQKVRVSAFSDGGRSRFTVIGRGIKSGSVPSYNKFIGTCRYRKTLSATC